MSTNEYYLLSINIFFVPLLLLLRPHDALEKKKKKKSASANNGLTKGTPSNKAEGRMLTEGSFTDYYVANGQTEPPTIPVVNLFRPKDDTTNTSLQQFPEGEIQEHPLESNVHRISSAELRASERLNSDLYAKLRHA